MSNDGFSPLFIVGSPRSGTTLLSRIISSHPEFSTYNAETLLLNVCKPKYGNIFRSGSCRNRFLGDWFRSRQFIESHLQQSRFIEVLNSSKNYTELLINFLEAISLSQNKNRIVDSTPSHYLYMNRIKRRCPTAKFINLIRDGRDVAISQVKLGWCSPPLRYSSTSAKLHYSTVQWGEVLKVSERGHTSSDVLNLRYEDLVAHPTHYEKLISEFLLLEPGKMNIAIMKDQDSSNTAFRSPLSSGEKTTERWKRLDSKLQAEMSYGVEEDLIRNGYEVYNPRFNLKLFLRYLTFKYHVHLKRCLIQLPLISRLSSGTLEIIEGQQWRQLQHTDE
ncbi:sulfotransferase family protein [Marinimicrobium locisalis]|uniref:sulfotransferase family protein n=1 Tax=Marinimicrobium locisalis TaxID=546022 RepID=UPI00322191E0